MFAAIARRPHVIMDATAHTRRSIEASCARVLVRRGRICSAWHDPDRIKAVVAYYPITDFPRWYAGERSGLSSRLVFALGRWQLRVESGASSDDDFQTMLRLASPLSMAELVRAPVLFVHGAQDTLLPLEESERMAERLKASGATTELLVVPGGERLFNFRQPQQATHAWQATLAWLDRYLQPTPRAGG